MIGDILVIIGILGTSGCIIFMWRFYNKLAKDMKYETRLCFRQKAEKAFYFLLLFLLLILIGAVIRF